MAFVGCAQPRVDTVQSYAGPQLPRPNRTLVHDFAVSPDQVKLDRGVSSRLLSALEGGSQAGQQNAAAQQVAAAISVALVERIQALGLPAERVDGSVMPAAGEKVLIIEGQILSVDEGNRTRRTIIGLGAGASEVDSDAQLYYQSPGRGSQLVQSFDAAAKSKPMPGMAETAGAGAAAGRVAESAAIGGGLHIGAEANGATVESDATRMADQLVKTMGPFFVAQGWIIRQPQ
jgi:hypothetical protein